MTAALLRSGLWGRKVQGSRGDELASAGGKREGTKDRHDYRDIHLSQGFSEGLTLGLMIKLTLRNRRRYTS
jgi:hypothetical protein